MPHSGKSLDYPYNSFGELLGRILNTLLMFWMYMFYPVPKLAGQGATSFSHIVALAIISFLALTAPFYVGRRFSRMEQVTLLGVQVSIVFLIVPLHTALKIILFLGLLALATTAICWFTGTSKFAK